MRFPHIKKPMTFDEIVAEYEQGDYNAEMLLQHLLLAHRQLREKHESLLVHMQREIDLAKSPCPSTEQ